MQLKQKAKKILIILISAKMNANLKKIVYLIKIKAIIHLNWTKQKI